MYFLCAAARTVHNSLATPYTNDIGPDGAECAVGASERDVTSSAACA